MQLLLVAGPGGSGSSTAAADLADRLAATDVRVAVADLDPWHGASAHLRADRVQVLSREDDPFVRRAAGLLDRVGLEARLAGELSTLPGAELIELLRRIHLARERADLDVLIVDAGSRAIELVAIADRLPWLATHLLQAQRGWLGAVRPVTATVLNRWPGAEGHDAARRAREATVSWSSTLRTARVVLLGDAAAARTRRLRLGLQLHELPVLAGSELAGWPPLPPAVPSPGARLSESSDGIAWYLPVPGLRSDELHIGRSGDDLAVDVLGVRRVVPMPSALRRYRAAGVQLRADEVVVQFVPKERSS